MTGLRLIAADIRSRLREDSYVCKCSICRKCRAIGLDLGIQTRRRVEIYPTYEQALAMKRAGKDWTKEADF